MILRHFTLSDSETVDLNAVFHIHSTHIASLEDSIFTNNLPLVFYIDGSQIDSFTRNTLTGMARGLRISEDSTAVISNSVFFDMLQLVKEGDTYKSHVFDDGSAIGIIYFLTPLEILDSNLTIKNSIFRNNIAVNGGAIKISCNYLLP